MIGTFKSNEHIRSCIQFVIEYSCRLCIIFKHKIHDKEAFVPIPLYKHLVAHNELGWSILSATRTRIKCVDGQFSRGVRTATTVYHAAETAPSR